MTIQDIFKEYTKTNDEIMEYIEDNHIKGTLVFGMINSIKTNIDSFEFGVTLEDKRMTIIYVSINTSEIYNLSNKGNLIGKEILYFNINLNELECKKNKLVRIK